MIFRTISYEKQKRLHKKNRLHPEVSGHSLQYSLLKITP